MKLIILCLILIASTASADFLTRDNGQVISIPDGFNTAEYDLTWNIRGMDEDGTFPGKAFVDAIIAKINAVPDDCTPKGELSLGGVACKD